MANIKVASAAQLNSTLKSAKAGDVITLAAGDYGHLVLREVHFGSDVTLKAAAGTKVSFSKVHLTKVTNVKFDGILFDQNAKSGTQKAFVFNKTKGVDIVNATFDGTIDREGYGSGNGIWVADSSEFRLEDSVIRGFHLGSHFRSTTGLSVKDNKFVDIAFDAMILGRVHKVLIEGNEIDLNTRKAAPHSDGIQFWNTGENLPSTDLTIRGNHIETNNTASHGIFMGNAAAATYGAAAAYRNVTIEDNVIVGGQVHGISLGRAKSADIVDNIVLQDLAVNDSRAVRTPVIRVDKTSADVEISGNVTHAAPTSASANWVPDKVANKAWTIVGNKIVKLGTRAEDVASGNQPVGTAPGWKEPGTTDPGGNGQADDFRFDGKKGGAFKARGLDFSEGDKINLIHFVNDTFEHVPGGNKLLVNIPGSYARIDSIADLHELDAASSRVKITDTGDHSILLTITQSGRTTHSIAFTDMAQDYDALL